MRRAGAHRLDRAEEDVMGADLDHLGDAAIEHHHGLVQHRRAGFQPVPGVAVEPLVHRVLRHAGEDR